MKVYNKNGDIVYSCDLRGEPLRRYYIAELDKLYGGNRIGRGYGSTILDFGLDGFPLSYDYKMIIDVAVRKTGYYQNWVNVKPFVVTPLEECLFYELQ
jgi:hypothetical protein